MTFLNSEKWCHSWTCPKYIKIQNNVVRCSTIKLSAPANNVQRAGLQDLPLATPGVLTVLPHIFEHLAEALLQSLQGFWKSKFQLHFHETEDLLPGTMWLCDGTALFHVLHEVLQYLWIWCIYCTTSLCTSHHIKILYEYLTMCTYCCFVFHCIILAWHMYLA